MCPHPDPDVADDELVDALVVGVTAVVPTLVCHVRIDACAGAVHCCDAILVMRVLRIADDYGIDEGSDGWR